MGPDKNLFNKKKERKSCHLQADSPQLHRYICLRYVISLKEVELLSLVWMPKYHSVYLQHPKQVPQQESLKDCRWHFSWPSPIQLECLRKDECLIQCWRVAAMVAIQISFVSPNAQQLHVIFCWVKKYNMRPGKEKLVFC